jgi:1-acyl-sn-glycerol-3-phosphate acyltransferase
MVLAVRRTTAEALPQADWHENGRLSTGAGLTPDPARYRESSRVVYSLMKIVSGPLLRFLGRPRVYGLRNIPAQGGALLASNHLSLLDSLFLGLVLRRRVTFLARSEYFTTPGGRGWLKRTFFTASGQISIDRNNERRVAEGLRRAVELLRDGELLGIYPEGTQSPDGRLYRGRTGVARLAMMTPAPVIPVAMTGTFHVLPGGRRMPRRGRVEIRIGEPLVLAADLDGTGADAKLLRVRTDEIMQAIATLSQQPYVDLDAQRFKAELGIAAVRRPAAEPRRVPAT